MLHGEKQPKNKRDLVTTHGVNRTNHHINCVSSFTLGLLTISGRHLSLVKSGRRFNELDCKLFDLAMYH